MVKMRFEEKEVVISLDREKISAQAIKSIMNHVYEAVQKDIMPMKMPAPVLMSGRIWSSPNILPPREWEGSPFSKTVDIRKANGETTKGWYIFSHGGYWSEKDIVNWSFPDAETAPLTGSTTTIWADDGQIKKYRIDK